MKTETYYALVNTKTGLIFNETKSSSFDMAKSKADIEIVYTDYDWKEHPCLQIKQVKVTIEIIG